MCKACPIILAMAFGWLVGGIMISSTYDKLIAKGIVQITGGDTYRTTEIVP